VGTCLSRTEIHGIRGIHKALVNDSCQPGHSGRGQAREPKRIGRLGCARIARGPPGGRCGIRKDRGGGLSGRTSFPSVGGVPFTRNLECQLKWGSETGHPSLWKLF
jgi:hypothetical protein